MCFFLVSFVETHYLCYRKNEPHWLDRETHQIFMKYRDKLRFSMAGHALRGNLESVDYKEDEHSNHVIRSFITSSVRLSYKKGTVIFLRYRSFSSFGRGDFLLSLLVYLSLVQCIPVFAGVAHVFAEGGGEVVRSREVFFGTHV